MLERPAISLIFVVMEKRLIRFVAISIVVCVLPLLLDANPIANSSTDVEEEQKVLEECQNSDYRTYIKCLKRQRRQHFPHIDSHPEIDSHCMESCLKQCGSSHHECEKDCAHCYRRTKHRHQIITEYETECSSGNCSGTDHNLPTTNITTKIDINNFINLNGSGHNNGSCCPHCVPPVPCIPPYGGMHLALVPQLTFGLGLGLSPSSFGGFGAWGGSACPYPGLCPPTSMPDCSGCGIPFMRYKCDVVCHSYGARLLQDNSQRTTTPCISPYCVGGT